MQARRATLLFLVLLAPAARSQDPCENPARCCVPDEGCVILDLETLEGLTLPGIVPCAYELATYHSGADGVTGVSPEAFPLSLCGTTYRVEPVSPALAVNELDNRWLTSRPTPIVMDFGSPVQAVLVFGSIDHDPYPEEGLEHTVWGSDLPDLTDFPTGWTRATLTTLYEDGWRILPACPDVDSDDYTAQHVFPEGPHRYVAVHAGFSVSVFDTPEHLSWSPSYDSHSVQGWQSDDHEIDAVGTPACDGRSVLADAGSPQSGAVGDLLCFDGNGASSGGAVQLFGWDLDGDGAIDAHDSTSCLECESAGSGVAKLFVTDSCGCVAVDQVPWTCREFACTLEGPAEAECSRWTSWSAVTIGTDAALPLEYEWSTDCAAEWRDAATDSPSVRFLEGGCNRNCTVTVVVSQGAQSTSCSAVVEVLDSTPPVLLAPSDLEVECPAPSSGPDSEAAWLTAAVASDDCNAASVEHRELDRTSACGRTYSLLVEFLAVDECGNASMPVQRRYTVVDDIPPTLAPPDDLEVECPAPEDGPGSLAAWLASATASDECGPAVVESLLVERVEGCGDTWTETHAFQAVDECGNRSPVVERTYSVVDTTPPAVSVGDELIGCLWPPNHSWATFDLSELDVTAADACSESELRIVGCDSDQPIDSTGDGHTAPDCIVGDDGTSVLVRAERQGHDPAGRRYSVHVVASDDCGNVSAPVRGGVIWVPRDQRGHEDCLRGGNER